MSLYPKTFCLEQYFGEEVVYDRIKDATKMRYTYGSGTGSGSVVMDPYNLVTRKITSDIHYIVSELYYISKSNSTLFIMNDVDMSTKFNHCTFIIYYAGKKMKDNYILAFHSDYVYSVSGGKYIILSNSQV